MTHFDFRISAPRIAAVMLVIGCLFGCATAEESPAVQGAGHLLRDTGQLLYQDTATDSFDGSYPGFNKFLNRLSANCNQYPIGNGTISTLIQSDSNMIDALSRLFAGKISQGDFSAFLGGWYSGTDTKALTDCVFAQLPRESVRQ
jgi:hypothetical protein